MGETSLRPYGKIISTMYSPIRLGIKYIQYYLRALNGKGHGVHSPFVFAFIKNVLNDKKNHHSFEKIESARKKLLNDNSIIEVKDFGAGSAVIKSNNRVVKKIAASSLKSKKIARLIFRMVKYYKPSTILELGTSFGITTSYLASAVQNVPVYTIEGAPSIAAIAENTFRQLDINNVRLVHGSFDDTLHSLLKEIKLVSLVFIDGNHRKEATVQYFDQLIQYSDESTILVFDDIHWSREMEEAWKAIRENPAVTLTIDLFFAGIVFFKKDFKVKQHFSIRF